MPHNRRAPMELNPPSGVTNLLPPEGNFFAADTLGSISAAQRALAGRG